MRKMKLFSCNADDMKTSGGFRSFFVYLTSVHRHVVTVLWKVSVYLSHASQIVQFIFVFKKKKTIYFPNNFLT